jgi:alkanesulfonate monooxygenase SsuD/methylene tetrahydromethanopterin reductase-like flavin-dependent oxidoreductase (luciferase family)
LRVAIIGGRARRFRPLIDVYRETGKRDGPPMTRASFDDERSPHGALLLGSPDKVVENILRHNEALGGISRISFPMNAASLPHAKLMSAKEIIGARVAPAVRAQTTS